MRRALVAVAIVTTVAGRTPHAQDPRGVVEAASYALRIIRGPQRVGAVNTLWFAGTGTMNAIGQAYRPDTAWPTFKLTSFRVSIKYADRALRFEMERTNPDGVVQGGGAAASAGAGRFTESGRWRLVSHRRYASQRSRGVQGLCGGGRRAAQR